MKQSNLFFLAGASVIILGFSFVVMIVWGLFTKTSSNPWPPKKQEKEAVAIQIKEVPVKVYVHDTVRIKIPCHKQHFETKIDTVQ